MVFQRSFGRVSASLLCCQSPLTGHGHPSPCPCSSDDVRHDVYLTLLHGTFNKGTKRADKNVELDVEVLDAKENPIPVRPVVVQVKLV